MAYAQNRGGYYNPGWDIFSDIPALKPNTPEGTVMTGLQTRMQSLEDAGNWLKDVKAPNVTPYTPVTTNLGRVASLRDFISSGDTAKVDSEMRRAVSMAQNKPQPEAAFTLGKVAEGYGQGKSNIMANAYKTAQQMHVGEVNAENYALAGQYEMNLKNAQAVYDLEMRKAIASETERVSLQEMMDKLILSSAKTPSSAISKPSVSTGYRSGSGSSFSGAFEDTIRMTDPYTGSGELLKPNDPRVSLWSQYYAEKAASQVGG